ncbi:hypothetical protein [Glutamicibacter ardleyensis]|uniref:hypothetical protein n=1 Tax=Glutamicibacter ardleyensis TaxID=225894 RepID=UPI003FD3EB65
MAQGQKVSTRKELKNEIHRLHRRKIKLHRNRRKNYREYAQRRFVHWKYADTFSLEDYMSIN